jgi:hypothetical protein
MPAHPAELSEASVTSHRVGHIGNVTSYYEIPRENSLGETISDFNKVTR